MSLIRNSVVPADVFANTVYLEKLVRLEGEDFNRNIVSLRPSVRIDIPGVEFGYDVETREFLYKKDGGEWTPMGK